MEVKSFDNILTELGFGKWNLYIFFVSATMYFLVPMQILSGTFTSPLVPFKCIVPPDIGDIEQFEDDQLINKCDVMVNLNENETNLVKCNDFEFDNSTFYSTMTSEFGLVCDYNFLRATYFSIYNLGNLFGSPLSGLISDKHGRRLTFCLGTSIYLFSAVLISWLPNMSAIMATRLLMGLTHACVIQSGFLLATEVVQPKHRSLVGILIALPWAFGTMLWALLGYLIRDWRHLQMASSIPSLFILPFIWFVDESPRWLVVMGRTDEALVILDKVQKWNNKKLPKKEELLPILVSLKKTKPVPAPGVKEDRKNAKLKKYFSSIYKLFEKSTMKTRVLVLMLDFFVASMVFYGMSINAVNFSADPYIYMALGGLMEVPSYTISAPIIQKFGRKYPVILGYLISGVMILALTFIPNDISWLVMSFAMIGKFTIASSYQIIYLFAAELIPTEIRQIGLGICNVMARFGSILCPYVVDVMGPIHAWLPSMIFGSVSILCGLVTMLTPETANKPIPDTINDV